MIYDLASGIFESAIIDIVGNIGYYTVTVPELGIAPSGNYFQLFYKITSIYDTYYENKRPQIYRANSLNIDCSKGRYLTLKDYYGTTSTNLIESAIAYFDSMIYGWFVSMNENTLSQPVLNDNVRLQAFQNCFYGCVFTTKWNEVL